jgi:TrmH family RNA methyltransferase
VRAISSRHHPIVQAYRQAVRGPRGGMLLIDGDHLVGEAEAAGLAIRHLAVSAARLETTSDPAAAIARRLERAGTEVMAVSASVMEALSPVRTPSGMVALADRPASELRQVLSARPALIVVAVDVQDPGNVGALVRASEAAGASGLVASGQSADPFGWKALRGSMGSAFRLPLATNPDPSGLLDDLHGQGIRTAAMLPTGGVSLYDAPLEGPLAIVLGSEGGGLPSALAAGADVAITIPMRAPVESLNVTVAGALILFEAARRRRTRAS